VPKVFLVEDDDTMRNLISTLLGLEGYQVVSYSGDCDMAQILHNIRAEMPSLLILDVHLRQSNGFELLRLIRKDQGLCNLPVLVSSGMELADESQREGADGFIVKPYMPEELISKIQGMLG